MTKEKLQHYNQLVADKVVNIEILILCLANLEPRISKQAYLKAKYKNSRSLSNGCYEYQMKLYMGYRKRICDLLVDWYPLDMVKKMTGQVDTDNMITDKLCDSVVALIHGAEFHVTED